MKYKTKSLVIFDWDDTLFPTTWAIKNNILSIKPPEKYFSYLDTAVNNLFNAIDKKYKVIIVTNASEKWVHKCINVMPKTKVTLKNTKIYSSREMFQKDYPSDNYMWKKLFFKYIIKEIYFNRNYIKDIISIGDAEYEYLALISLYVDPNNNIDNIKTIKLARFPTKEDLLKEIYLLKSFIPSLLKCKETYDLHISL